MTWNLSSADPGNRKTVDPLLIAAAIVVWIFCLDCVTVKIFSQSYAALNVSIIEKLAISLP